MSKHIAVLMGGWSNEREVSLKSGEACASALERIGHKVSRIDVDQNVARVLEDLKPDVAFNALHGRYGEDGTIQGLLEILKIPYTHSGVLASSLAMHKEKAKVMFQKAGIPVATSKVVDRTHAAKIHVLPPPYVVKPVDDGSSVGIFLIRHEEQQPPQQLLSADWKSGEDVMVEHYIPGRELTCAVMGNVALGVTEIETEMQFYNYEAKYEINGSKHTIPAKISPKIYQDIQKLSLAAHLILGCRGVTRTDFRFNEQSDGNGKLYCLEINTQPGMTETSLVPELAQYAGHSFEELVQWMVDDASCNR